MAFDLSEVLKNVSGPDTGKQQIQYIDLARIDPDPDNFYSLEGIDELAGSIEMLGLQQPLLVRPTKDGRYTVISGHRRRAALMLIRDGGSQQFADGVPCIVDYAEASDALRELKLIMANSDTRKMSSADQNTQAERIEDLLRQLQDEGFEFPGRLRDWVAKLSGMSRTKLARLKVIRDGLEPGIVKKYYKSGKLKEEAAYELARLPERVQKAVVTWYETKQTRPEYWYSNTIKQYGEDYLRVENYVCPNKFGGNVCVNQSSIMERIWEGCYRSYCHCSNGKKCCATCDELTSCRKVCGHMLPKAEQLRQEKRAQYKAQKEAEAQAERPVIERIRDIWFRFGLALSRANLTDEELRKLTGQKFYQLDEIKIAALEAGEAKKITTTCVLPFFNSSYLRDVDRYVQTADALGCSLDYLLCRTDVPELAAKSQQDTDAAAKSQQDTDAAAKSQQTEDALSFVRDGKLTLDGIYTALDWQTGQPLDDGRYLCLVDMGTQHLHEQRCEYRDGRWMAYGQPVSDLFTVAAWWPLPPAMVCLPEDQQEEEADV